MLPYPVRGWLLKSGMTKKCIYKQALISSPFGPLYWVTSIMSQRSLFIHALGNIFYEAIPGPLYHQTSY